MVPSARQSPRQEEGRIREEIFSMLRDLGARYNIDLVAGMELRSTLERNIPRIREITETEFRDKILRPILDIVARSNPRAAIEIEMDYCKRQGIVISNETRQSMLFSFDGLRGIGETSEHNLFFQDNNVGLYHRARDQLDTYLRQSPPRVTQQSAEVAYRAFRYGIRLRELYSQRQTDSRDFDSIMSARNAELATLGFRNSNQAVLPRTALTPALLVPAEGGHLLNSIQMFNAFLAPIILQAADCGFIQLQPADRQILLDDLRSTAGGWGYSMLDSFVNRNVARYILNLRSDYVV